MMDKYDADKMKGAIARYIVFTWTQTSTDIGATTP
jgi:hypothetical protein